MGRVLCARNFLEIPRKFLDISRNFLDISDFLTTISDSRHVQLSIYTVFQEESESAVRIDQFFHPEEKIEKNRPTRVSISYRKISYYMSPPYTLRRLIIVPGGLIMSPGVILVVLVLVFVVLGVVFEA